MQTFCIRQTSAYKKNMKYGNPPLIDIWDICTLQYKNIGLIKLFIILYSGFSDNLYNFENLNINNYPPIYISFG